MITDASFIRLKNLSVSYKLSNKVLERIKLEGLRFYIIAQNLFTITNYKGADPETQSLLALPPLKVLTAGIQITL